MLALISAFVLCYAAGMASADWVDEVLAALWPALRLLWVRLLGRDGRGTAPRVLFRCSTSTWAGELSAAPLPWAADRNGTAAVRSVKQGWVVARARPRAGLRQLHILDRTGRVVG